MVSAVACSNSTISRSARSRVIVGPKAALATHRLRLRDVNWLGDGPLDAAVAEGFDMQVKVRSTSQPVRARLGLDAAGGRVLRTRLVAAGRILGKTHDRYTVMLEFCRVGRRHAGQYPRPLDGVGGDSVGEIPGAADETQGLRDCLMPELLHLAGQQRGLRR